MDERTNPMFGRKAAYKQGYIAALDDLKCALFEDVKRRNDERNPHTLATLSETVIETINNLRQSVVMRENQ